MHLYLTWFVRRTAKKFPRPQHRKERERERDGTPVEKEEGQESPAVLAYSLRSRRFLPVYYSLALPRRLTLATWPVRRFLFLDYSANIMMPLSIKLAGLVLCAAVAAAALQERQLHSLPPQGSTSSATTTTTASSSTTTSTTATTMSTQTGPTRWELSTVFTQPTDCLGGITQYAGGLSTLGYWLNIPYPAPGVTVTSCFPPALVASVTASVDLPPLRAAGLPGPVGVV